MRRALGRWKVRFGTSIGGGDMGEPGSTDLPAGPPFTGEPPKAPTLPGGWIQGFSTGPQDEDDEEHRE